MLVRLLWSFFFHFPTTFFLKLNKMKLKKIYAVFQVTIILLLSSQSAYSDVINFKNGDKLTGEVLSLSGGILKFSTDYSKEIKIDDSQVKSLRTNQSVRVLLKNGWKIKGKLKPTDDGLYSIRTGNSNQRAFIDFKEITSINAPKEKLKAWKGKIHAGGSHESGNTERLTFNFGGEGELKFNTERFELKFLTVYTEENDQITSRKTFGRIQYDHFFTEKWYGLLSMETLNDKFKNLNLRLAVGPGVGYHYWNDDIKKLKLEAGITYFSEDLKNGIDTQFMTGRLAGKFDYKFSEVLSFRNESVMFPSFEKVGDYKLRNEAGFNTQLAKGWSLNLSHILDYDNNAPSGTKSSDSTITFGLQYDF
jgi:putative salt-induced outer membrane protein YdiY